MSKKGKLTLATALFGAALFGASCGGGGGGTAAGGGGGGGNQPPPATEEGRVLALLDVGGASAGTLNPVTICQLKSDNKAYCGSDLNPSANVDLYYGYEFPNGNVVLAAGNVLYFFDGNQVIRPDKYRALGGISDISAPSGINIPSGTVTYYATDDFVIIHSTGGGDTVIAVSKTGKVIKGTGISSSDINASCGAVTKGGTTYKLNTDGTSSSTTIPTFRVEAGGKYLVSVPSGTNLNIYLSDSRCRLANAVLIRGNLSNFAGAKMAESGGKYYIAISHGTGGTSLNYYRVSGDSATDITPSGGITLHTNPTIYFYDLDGRGVLYAITAVDTVTAYKPTDGSSIGTGTVTGVDALLPFADRVLARGSANVFDVHASDTAVTVTSKGDTSSALYTAVSRCTAGSSNTRAIDGVRTNFIRCVYESGTTRVLYSLTTNDSGTYGNAYYNLPAAFNDVRWAPNKALVSVDSPATIHLCNTTTTPTISCSETDLPDIDPTNIDSGKYLKFNGNNVFYLSGSTLKVGDIFGTLTTLPIAVASATGGNASFDLTKFAFSFRPAGAACNTQIAYLSSRTASPKTYTIAQPSNACVERILKVY
jgi:hypothetical protein